jgi:hypothetical protein
LSEGDFKEIKKGPNGPFLLQVVPVLVDKYILPLQDAIAYLTAAVCCVALTAGNLSKQDSTSIAKFNIYRTPLQCHFKQMGSIVNLFCTQQSPINYSAGIVIIC